MLSIQTFQFTHTIFITTPYYGTKMSTALQGQRKGECATDRMAIGSVSAELQLEENITSLAI